VHLKICGVPSNWTCTEVVYPGVPKWTCTELDLAPYGLLCPMQFGEVIIFYTAGRVDRVSTKQNMTPSYYCPAMSSTSAAALFVEQPPSLRRDSDDSKSSSCPMKLRLGEACGRQRLTSSYASSSDRLIDDMRYATATVTDRLMPARQWTSTPHCTRLASSAITQQPANYSTTLVPVIR